MKLKPQSELESIGDAWYNRLKWWATDFLDMAVLNKPGEWTTYTMPEEVMQLMSFGGVDNKEEEKDRKEEL